MGKILSRAEDRLILELHAAGIHPKLIARRVGTTAGTVLKIIRDPAGRAKARERLDQLYADQCGTEAGPQDPTPEEIAARAEEIRRGWTGGKPKRRFGGIRVFIRRFLGRSGKGRWDGR